MPREFIEVTRETRSGHQRMLIATRCIDVLMKEPDGTCRILRDDDESLKLSDSYSDISARLIE
jgi:hypothetical protein